MNRINDGQSASARVGVGISILFAAFCLISPFHEPPTEILCVSHVDGKIVPYTKDSRDDSAKEMGSENADAQEVFDLTIDDMKQPSEAKEDMSPFEGEFNSPGVPVISLHLCVFRLHRLISCFSLILHHFLP